MHLQLIIIYNCVHVALSGTSRDQGGYTPLLLAAHNGSADVVNILMDAGASLDAQHTVSFFLSDA